MKLDLIKYLNVDKYSEKLDFYKNENFLILELDFNTILSLDQFKSILNSRINAPAHYFNNFLSVYDLFEDFPSFNNSCNMVILIKNYGGLKKLNIHLYHDFLDVLNKSSKYLNKSREGNLETYVFLNKKELKELKKLKIEKTIGQDIKAKTKLLKKQQIKNGEYLTRNRDSLEERGKMGKLIILINLIFFLALITTPHLAYAADQYKPYLHNPSVGDVPKLEAFGEFRTELFPGAGAYIYEIEVPKGTVGLQPSLTILYNSQSAIQRPSVLGSGWSLTENNIIRNVNYTINDSRDDYFTFSLGNSKLKVYYNGSAFNAELNPREYKIENLTNNGKIYWIITTRDGVKYRFGYNNDSLLDSNTGRNYSVKWSLDQVQDTHDNKIFYTYLEDPFSGDNGTVYLSNISYNNDQLRKIFFVYEPQSRPDRRLVYEQGNRLDESRRLSRIYVHFNNSVVRRYDFFYTNLNTEKSLSGLANITYIGSDNSSVLNTLKFEYYETLQGFDNATNKWVVPESFAFSSTDASGKDFGIRLIDVNNDGFPDLVKAKGGSRETRLNNKTNGWDSSSLFVSPVDIVDNSNIYQGVRFEDINADGLIDILKSKTGSKAVYLNNGTGWYDATANWTIPVDFINSDNKDVGVEMVDLNLDGKADILWSQEPSTNTAYLNNGTGWKTTSDWVVPDYFVKSDNKDNGLRIIDLNNDGLPDLIKGGTPGNAWINNGTAWENYSQYAPSLSFVDHDNDRPDLGVRFMDINGDGLVDILQNFLSNVSYLNATNGTEYNITFDSNTKLNNGTGWVQTPGWISPERFTDQGFNIGRRIADINGDGYADILVAYSISPYLGLTHLKNATNALLLKKITNVYGGITEINYKQSTLNNNGNELGFNIWLVGNTSLNNSLTGDFATGSRYSYIYSGGKYDYILQEFRGFARVNETLPDNSTIAHFFHQDNVLKGREFRTTIYDSSNKIFVDNLQVFTNSSNGMIFLNTTSTQLYDKEPTPIVNNITYDYDQFGNLIKVNNSGDTIVNGDEKIEFYNYVYNTTAYIVSKPVNYTLFASDGTTIVKRSFYFYDNLSSGVNKGDLTKVRNYNGGSDPEVQYTYDSFGNKIKQTEPLGYNTTYTYDSTYNTYLIKETNQLGQTVSYDYDFGTGNLLSEVRHGLNKTYTYDVFGRIRTETISPDTIPTKNYTYSLDGVAPEIINIQTKGFGSNYSETLYLYDGFSNTVQTKTLNSDGKQIVKNFYYDNKYRIKEEQNPYFDTYSAGLSMLTTGLRIGYTYDSLDRVINLTKQDNSSIIVIFNRTLVTQYDENNNRIDYSLDGQDRIKSVLEHEVNSSGTYIYTTNYSYRADSNLLKITDTKGNNFSFSYDFLGRKTVFDDPNMQNWTYNYDLNGNLINQTDGRNITTNLTYDKLNRVTIKSGGNTTVKFVYDGQFNGTLTNITLNASYYLEPLLKKYSYDNRLRVIREDLYLCYRSQSPDNRCAWINYSVDYDSQDRILNMYLPNKNISYEYNSIGKLSKANGFLNSVNYNAFGKISNKTFSNNLVMKIDYDELSRVSRLQTGSIQNLSYKYDNVSNIKSINDTKNSKTYTMEYDSLNRLISTNVTDLLTSEVLKFRYVYNPIGNLINIFTNDQNISYTYGDLAHAPTALNISEPTVIEVTECGALQFSNVLYILQNTILINGSTCFTVEANNITLNGNGYTVDGNDTQNTRGVEAVDVGGLIIKDITIRDFESGIYFESSISGNYITLRNVQSISNSVDGIWIKAGDGKHFLYNTTSNSNSGNGIYLGGTSSVRKANLTNIAASNNLADGIHIETSAFTGIDYTLTNIITEDNTGDGVDLYNSPRTLITNLFSQDNSDELEISDGDNSRIYDSNLISSLRIDTTSTNITLVNVSYSTENIDSASNLTRKWYYKAYANDTTGLNVSNANITAYNASSSHQFNLTTDTTGYTSMTEIIDYINNGGNITYYSPYTVYASNSSYPTINHQLNVTNLTNIYKEVFTFGTIGGLTTCSALDQANTIYTVSSNITTTTTCFNITADNVTLDGNGYSIIGDKDSVDYGVYAIGRINSTVKNIRVINFSRGIYFKDTNNSLIDNSTSIENSQYGIFLASSFNNNVKDSIANSNLFYGIVVANSNNNKITSNIANLNTYYGIYLDTSSNNLISGGNINASGQYAIRLQGDSLNNNLTNITITNSAQNDIFFASAGINGTYLIDMPHIGNYSITGVGGIIIFKDSTFGEIRFLNPINGSGTNLTNDVRIKNNSVTVESSVNIGLNRSANITLYGIGNRGFVNPKILRGLLECNNCYNFTSLTATNVKFNVSHWTTYSIGDVVNDTQKFIIQNSSGNRVVWFGSKGNIVLKGSCTNQSLCAVPVNPFAIKNASGSVMAYVDVSNGNMCIKSNTSCQNSAQQVSCSSPNPSFIIQNSTGGEVIVIDRVNGNLCLTGGIYENVSQIP